MSVGRRESHVEDTAAGGRPSLVDVAEQAVRSWLAPGRYREGDRLPPEHELASMLGVSRGTLRSALSRLELNGEIVRRQGSGTFVGKLTTPMSFGEQLQKLESYATVARRHGVAVTAADVVIEHRPATVEEAEALRLAPGVTVIAISRTVLAAGQPAAVTRDVFHPEVVLGDHRRLKRRLRDGATMLDLLTTAEIPVSWSRAEIAPRLLDGSDVLGRRLGLRAPTACLELTEVIFAEQGNPVLFSCDVFTPDGIEIEVMRSVDTPRARPVAKRERDDDAPHG